MYRIIFLIQFIFLITGIILVKGETVPTPVSMTLSFSFLVFAYILWRKNRDVYGKYIALASVFCFIGDLILADVIGLGFLAGLGFFAVAQTFNIIAFIKTARLNGKNALNKGFWCSLAILVPTIALIWWIFLKPTFNSDLTVFIALLYGIWLCIMVASAVALFYNNRQYVFSLVGASFFAASDLIIGITGMGEVTMPFRVAFIWITYVIALGCIIYSRNLLHNPPIID